MECLRNYGRNMLRARRASILPRSVQILTRLLFILADIRWGEANETVVALELLTVLIGGPMCLYIAYQMMKGDRVRHYWIIVLS